MKMRKKNATKYSLTMLIDDNEIDNFINSKMIEATQFSNKIQIYTNGLSAIEALRNICNLKESAEQLIPDVIFLDLNMPIMDGFQFLKQFDKLPRSFTEKINIHILTTSVNPDDINDILKNKKVGRYLNKPLSEKTLRDL